MIQQSTFLGVNIGMSHRLPVIDGGVRPCLLTGDWGISLDENTHLLSFELNSETQRRDVEKKEIRHLLGTGQILSSSCSSVRKNETLHHIR